MLTNNRVLKTKNITFKSLHSLRSLLNWMFRREDLQIVESEDLGYIERLKPDCLQLWNLSLYSEDRGLHEKDLGKEHQLLIEAFLSMNGVECFLFACFGNVWFISVFPFNLHRLISRGPFSVNLTEISFNMGRCSKSIRWMLYPGLVFQLNCEGWKFMLIVNLFLLCQAEQLEVFIWFLAWWHITMNQWCLNAWFWILRSR